MNKHLFRVVFNKSRSKLVVVAENVASDGAGGVGTSGKPGERPMMATVRPLCFSILLALGAVGTAANAQIVADPNAPKNQQPTVLNSANGVPLVNIQTPSAAGVSRNTYSQFDVNSQGAILNNARNSTQTQLGGYVQGNPWLANGTARVILNEVNASNPSQLRGYVEVAGDRAQVVIANAAGISCDGCGFINANQVTLTTGTPLLNGGSLEGYRVEQGAVSISGGGLDASRVDYTDIIARSVQVNAGIWAQTLKVSAGANEVSADHAQVAALAPSGPAPSYAIDVAALGGMYAGKITLVGTEAGVGVRNAGQIGASAGDVVVTADGRLENSGRITASAGVRADTNGGVANIGTLYAQGDTQLTTRGAVDNTGVIAAQGQTSVTAAGAHGSVNSGAGSLIGAGVRADGTVGGGAHLQVRTGGQLTARGQTLASGDLSLVGAGVDAVAGQLSANNVSLTANAGDLDASRATISATQALTANAAGTLRTDGGNVSADRLQLSAHDLTNVQGQLVQTGGTDLLIQLPGRLDNTHGRIATNSANMSLEAQALWNTAGRIEHAGAGSLFITANTLSGSQGVMGTNGVLQLAGQSITLDAGQTSGDSVRIQAGSLSNRGGQLTQAGNAGTAWIQATGVLDNTGGLLAANGADLTLTAGALVNADGQITHAGTGSLVVRATTVDGARGAIDGNGGLVLSAQSVTLDSARTTAVGLTIEAATLSNRAGQILQTGEGATSIQASQRFDNTSGRLATNGTDLMLGAATLINDGGHIEHTGNGALTLTATTIAGARGVIASNGTLALQAQSVTLDGGQTLATTLRIDSATLSNRAGQLLQTGAGAASIQASQRLDNTGGTVASNGTTILTVGDLLNQGGTLQAAGSSALTVHAAGQVDNSAQGRIVAGGAGAVTAASLSNAEGTLTAGETLQVTTAGALDNTQGVLAANRDVNIKSSVVTNASGRIGSVQGNASVIATSGALVNTTGRVDAAQTVNLASHGLTNNDGVVSGQDVQVDTRLQALDNARGTVAARGSLDLRSGQLINDAGSLQAVGAMTVDTHGQALINRNSGASAGILGQDAVTLRTGDLNNSTGFIGAKGDVNATAAQITNTQGGQISGEGAVALSGSGLDNRGGSVQALGGVSADVGTGTVDNAGGLMRSGATLDVRAGLVTNAGTQGSNQGLEARNVSLTADQINNQTGLIRADQALTLTGAGVLNNTQGMISSGQSVLVQDRNAASRTQSVVNTGGTMLAGQSLGVNSAGLSGDGHLLSQGDMSLSLTGDFTNTGEVQANGSVTLQTGGRLTNQSAIKAGNTVTVSAGNIDNATNGEISAGTTTLNVADTLTNRGLIDGGNTNINAGTVNNLGTGRIYGDHVAIGASVVLNDVENGTAATIAARGRLDIGAGTITNREHALIFSGGDMVLAGALDANRMATGSASVINNNSASIEALGNLALAAGQVRNTNEHFSTGLLQSAPEHIIEYQGSGSPNRYRQGDTDVYVYNDETDHLHTPEGAYESWSKYEYDRTTTKTVVTGTDPGKITAGGAMLINAGTVLNDKSQIIAGGALLGTIGSLQNTDVSGQQTVSDSGTATSYWRDHHKGRDSTGSSSTAYTPPDVISEIKLAPTVYLANTAPTGSGTHVAAHTVGSVTQGPLGALLAQVTVGAGGGVGVATPSVQMPVGVVGQPVNPVTEVPALAPAASGQSQVVRTGGVNTTVPDNSLFHVSPNPTGGHLIETDPRFANYRTWLSSDYMLSQLGMDPTVTQKRLGDGFYEQKLVREQVAQLTGRRFIDGYSTDEAQYQALIDNGVTYAKAWDLRPGVALTDAQMAQLTSDIVWLVEKDVTLPNGQTTKALVPQVYVHVKPGDLDGSGALISGQSVALNLTGDLVNQGSIAGRDVLSITAENVKNLGGRLTGGDVAVQARTDLDNLGGLIDAGNSLQVSAGRDLNVTTTLRSNSNAQGSVTNINRVAGLYVSAPSGGVLVASAGRDLTLTGAQVINDSTGGQTIVAAGRDLNLTTVEVSNSQSLAWNSSNLRKDSSRQEVGSTIQTAGDVRLAAGNDLNARGATVTSDQGALVATAGNNVNLTAAESSRTVDEAHQHTGSSSAFSKKTITTRDTLSETTTQATTLSANTAYVQAGNDINVRGSNVVSTEGTALIAKNDINVEGAANTTSQTHFSQTKQSGLMGTGGIGFTAGSRQTKDTTSDTQTVHEGSTIGSVAGNVTMSAGRDLTLKGSDVVAGQDVALVGRNVSIEAVQDTAGHNELHEVKQSGLTVALKSAITDTAQAVYQSAKSAKDAPDGRLTSLYAAKAGATLMANYDDAAKEASAVSNGDAGSVSIQLSVGSSKSKSTSDAQASYAHGSQVLGGGNVSIVAAGEKDANGKVLEGTGNLTAIGSTIKGQNVTLDAANDLVLKSAQDTTTQKSTNSNSGWSAGVGLSLGQKTGITFSASGYAGKGHADGDSVQQVNTNVEATDTLTIRTGRDATLAGAQAAGQRVVADIGRDLTIRSVQDTMNYHADQKQVSAGASFTYGSGGGSANMSVNWSKADAEYASVNRQTGLFGGAGGYDVQVGNHTQLDGGAIASTATADKNSFSTNSLGYTDVENHKEASAKAGGVSMGSDMMQNPTYSLGKSALGGLMANAGKSSSDSSTTYAVVGNGTLEIRGDDKQAAAGLRRDIDGATRALTQDDMGAMQDSVNRSSEAGRVMTDVIVTLVDDGIKKFLSPQAYKVFCIQQPCTNDQAANSKRLNDAKEELTAAHPDWSESKVAEEAFNQLSASVNNPNRDLDAKGVAKVAAGEQGLDSDLLAKDGGKTVNNIQVVPVTVEELAKLTDDEKKGSTVFSNGIFNTRDRAAQLALQMTPTNANRAAIESSGETTSNPTYLVHTDKASNFIGELFVAGVEKAAEAFGFFTPAGNLKADLTQELLLSRDSNGVANTNSNGSLAYTNLVYDAGHSRGTMTQTDELRALAQRGVTNSPLVITVNNPATYQSNLTAASSVVAQEKPTFWAPGNDPVARAVGWYAGSLTWTDMTQMYSTSYSVHSCGGAAAIGCSANNVNEKGGVLFKYEDLSIDVMNINRNSTAVRNLNAWLPTPQPVVMPSFNMNSLQNNRGERDWLQQLRQVPSVSSPQVQSPIGGETKPDLRLNQLEQLQQQLAPTKGQ
ncbi:filamentous hemagglutinin [Roseateles sp. YR242]|uniref:hemagglutinin repeat-containing protein n=1 Tax=Roseateles sp. YR242 TaxID=1855305 RepID=UPI0008BD2078|nr:hemagglutinin repeat-containing protein [Roseateles sp. YR242]SEL90289.1 filamentous hemagglutinin [Roseateles sp. YR242]